MTIEEENKAFILKGYELLNNGDLTGYINLHDPEFTEHFSDGDMSLEQTRELLIGFYRAFPDAKSTVEDILAEGDKVAWRVTHRGTHQGEFMGIAPTGIKIQMTVMGIARITDGKWMETSATADTMHVMQQLGAIPKQ